MNKSDRDKMLVVGFLLAFILVAVGFIFGTQAIPVKWIAIAIIIIQAFYAVPRAGYLYYKALGQELGVQRFIPLWNEIMMFSGKYPILVLSTWVAFALVYSVTFVPGTVVESVLGSFVALQYGYWAARIAIVILVVNNFILGAAYVSVFRDTKTMQADLTKDRSGVRKTDVMYYVMMYVPIVRCASIVVLCDRLSKLVLLNGYCADQIIDSELQEEE